MNNKGVGAVIGVILMVAITVAIATATYLWIDNMIGESEVQEEFSGNITEKFRTGSDYVYYHFVIDDSFDLRVTETIYYKYDIGDYYEI